MLSLFAISLLTAGVPKNVDAFHDWYGVYLQGKKVGFLESGRSKRSDGSWASQQTMTAKIAGMGQAVSVEVLTEHVFDGKSGALTGLTFRQTAPTGAVEVSGTRKPGATDFPLNVKAAGETRTISASTHETIEEVHAGEWLARDKAAKVGSKRSVKVFDASIQKLTTINYEISKIEQRILDGVSVPVRFVKSVMPDLNIEEESVFSPDGRVLESHIAGLFTIRLEDEKRAKDVGYSQDVLVTFVVPVDRKIEDPGKVSGLKVNFTGAKNFAMPSHSRQTSTVEGDQIKVSVQRHQFAPESSVSLPISAAVYGADLKPEPLIQSDSPELRRQALSIVGKEKNAYRAAHKLLDWVYRNVDKAYVPAVSNALEVYKTRKGDCGEHAALFVALARAAGIPARPVVGITYWPPGNGFGYHAWAEIFVGEWIQVDPTQNAMSADATHIQLAGGDLAEQAKITMLIGKLKAQIEEAR